MSGLADSCADFRAGSIAGVRGVPVVPPSSQSRAQGTMGRGADLTPGPTVSPSHDRPTHVTWGERNAMASMTTVVLPGHSGGAVPESHRSSLASPPSPAAEVGHHRLTGECRGGADPVNETRRRPYNRQPLPKGSAQA